MTLIFSQTFQSFHTKSNPKSPWNVQLTYSRICKAFETTLIYDFERHAEHPRQT